RLASYLKALPTRDNRIKVQINERNGGISAATNCCLSLASGEFVALLDHDDILTLDALSKVVEVLNRRPDLDLIYTDECRVNEQDTPIDMFRKPDWSSAMLLNYMYTGHFSVYRRHIVGRAGGFRS
ncbi:glycosyltransferase, partial [Burkholderia cenocepacia]|uniref:glycosyltransferase n=1 Tax=Burkholderia cenocepacia TaxID=95486 RepID=UPI00222E7A13